MLRAPHRFLHFAWLCALLVACGDDGGGSDPAGAGGGGGAGAGTTTGAGAGATTGTGAGGSGGSGGGIAVDCSSLPLCDDFEGAAPGGPPDPAIWSVVSPDCSGSGALAIDDTQARSGSRSVRVDGGGTYCDHVFIANSAALGGLGPAVYGRFFVRFQDPLGQGHVTFLAMNDVTDGDRDLRMSGQSQILMWNRESDDATLPALSPAGIAESVAPAPGAWTCVEFFVDGSAYALETWVDGVEVPGLRVDGEATPDIDQQWHNQAGWAPSLTDLKVGWESYAGQSMVLWIDDVALATARIGCE